MASSKRSPLAATSH